jgi:hypothetical protein
MGPTSSQVSLFELKSDTYLRPVCFESFSCSSLSRVAHIWWHDIMDGLLTHGGSFLWFLFDHFFAISDPTPALVFDLHADSL